MTPRAVTVAALGASAVAAASRHPTVRTRARVVRAAVLGRPIVSNVRFTAPVRMDFRGRRGGIVADSEFAGIALDHGDRALAGAALWRVDR